MNYKLYRFTYNCQQRDWRESITAQIDIRISERDDSATNLYRCFRALFPSSDIEILGVQEVIDTGTTPMKA